MSDVNQALLEKAFRTHAKHGFLHLRHIRAALQQMALYPSEETLFELVHKYHKEGPDGKMPPGLSFTAFAALVTAQRCGEDAKPASDSAIVEAFVALGGNPNRTGDIRTDLLRHVIKEEFALPIDIDRLISEIDLDAGGTLDFEEVSVFLRQRHRSYLPPMSGGSKASAKK